MSNHTWHILDADILSYGLRSPWLDLGCNKWESERSYRGLEVSVAVHHHSDKLPRALGYASAWKIEIQR